jgi:serine/threonine protein kinase
LDHSDAEHVEPTGDAGLELVGPYTLIAEIASGDFTSVHLAQRDGALGFNRLAAIKRLRPGFAKQPEWTQLLLDEARLSAVVRHPNIVDILDVGTDAGVYIVMEYVEGADLDVLIGRAGKERHPRYLVPPIVDALTGLHAVHTAHDELGESLSMVHQAPRARHILIGIDGVSRITDFSQVSARGLIPSTLRGKRLTPGYMAPEQVLVSEPVSPRTDVFIAGITLWETLTGARLFHADTPALARRAITERHIPRPSEVGLKPPRSFDDICMRALQRNPEQRYQSALEMAQELRDVALNEALYASAGELGQWVRALASRALVERRRALGADEPSQEIPLPASEARAPTVQVAFTSAEPPPLPPRDSLFGVSTQVQAGAQASAAWPSSNTAVSRAPEPEAPIADDPSRVARSFTVPVAPAVPPRQSSRPAGAKSTLMGISPQPRASRPPAALGTTHGYESQSYDAQGYDAQGYDAQGYDARSRDSSAFLDMTIPPAASTPTVARGRRKTGLSSTLIGSKPPNVTLPEGALLQDMQLGSRAAPSYVPPPSIVDTSSKGTSASNARSTGFGGAASVGGPSYAAPVGSSTVNGGFAQPHQSFTSPPPASTMPPASNGFTDAFGASDELHPPLQSSSAAQRLIDAPEQGSPRSGAYRTRAPSRTPSAPLPRSLAPSPFATADGVVPADIFARVQAARREAGDSLRPASFGGEAGGYEGERSPGVGLSSLLLIGVLAIGFFGYRQWLERAEPDAPSEQPQPNAAAPGAEPVDPLPAIEPALPAELAAPQEPTAAPLPPSAVPVPQAAPSEPVRPSAAPQVREVAREPARASAAPRPAPRRPAQRAQVRQPNEPVAKPARPASGAAPEPLPDNPY